jgi:hypothetical protein
VKVLADRCADDVGHACGFAPGARGQEAPLPFVRLVYPLAAGGVPMTVADDSIRDTLQKEQLAEEAMYRGDPEPFKAHG